MLQPKLSLLLVIFASLQECSAKGGGYGGGGGRGRRRRRSPPLYQRSSSTSTASFWNPLWNDPWFGYTNIPNLAEELQVLVKDWEDTDTTTTTATTTTSSYSSHYHYIPAKVIRIESDSFVVEYNDWTGSVQIHSIPKERNPLGIILILVVAFVLYGTYRFRTTRKFRIKFESWQRRMQHEVMKQTQQQSPMTNTTSSTTHVHCADEIPAPTSSCCSTCHPVFALKPGLYKGMTRESDGTQQTVQVELQLLLPSPLLQNDDRNNKNKDGTPDSNSNYDTPSSVRRIVGKGQDSKDGPYKIIQGRCIASIDEQDDEPFCIFQWTELYWDFQTQVYGRVRPVPSTTTGGNRSQRCTLESNSSKKTDKRELPLMVAGNGQNNNGGEQAIRGTTTNSLQLECVFKSDRGIWGEVVLTWQPPSTAQLSNPDVNAGDDNLASPVVSSSLPRQSAKEKLGEACVVLPVVPDFSKRAVALRRR